MILPSRKPLSRLVSSSCSVPPLDQCSSRLPGPRRMAVPAVQTRRSLHRSSGFPSPTLAVPFLNVRSSRHRFSGSPSLPGMACPWSKESRPASSRPLTVSFSHRSSSAPILCSANPNPSSRPLPVVSRTWRSSRWRQRLDPGPIPASVGRRRPSNPSATPSLATRQTASSGFSVYLVDGPLSRGEAVGRPPAQSCQTAASGFSVSLVDGLLSRDEAGGRPSARCATWGRGLHPVRDRVPASCPACRSDSTAAVAVAAGPACRDQPDRAAAAVGRRDSSWRRHRRLLSPGRSRRDSFRARRPETRPGVPPYWVSVGKENYPEHDRAAAVRHRCPPPCRGRRSRCVGHGPLARDRAAGLCSGFDLSGPLRAAHPWRGPSVFHLFSRIGPGIARRRRLLGLVRIPVFRLSARADLLRVILAGLPILGLCSPGIGFIRVGSILRIGVRILDLPHPLHALFLGARTGFCRCVPIGWRLLAGSRLAVLVFRRVRTLGGSLLSRLPLIRTLGRFGLLLRILGIARLSARTRGVLLRCLLLRVVGRRGFIAGFRHILR